MIYIKLLLVSLTASKYQYKEPPFQEWSRKADFAELPAHNRELAAKPAPFQKANKGEKEVSKIAS